MTDCLFCKIATGDIPATILAESEHVVVFADVHPQAPVHLLAIPREHHEDVAALAAADPTLAGELLAIATQAAQSAGLDEGHRVVFNTGRDGGQTVPHVHAHVIGGRQMTWPPG
ncbi:MAG: histidine triad nucleotide-binding protein [Candidatus Nanopelagicales bacterium]